ncbi:hypothetical protein D3C87_2027320 [compost metagenome]
MPVAFWEAMATIASGTPKPMMAFQEKAGAVHTGWAMLKVTPLKSSRPMAYAMPNPANRVSMVA